MEKITLRPFRAEDAVWLIAQHGALYQRDEGFDASFTQLVAEIVEDFIVSHDPACEAGWIAEQDDQRLGSIFCVRLSGEIAKLRLFLLVPEARGKGAGPASAGNLHGIRKGAGLSRHATLDA
jgi:hypothetical protein